MRLQERAVYYGYLHLEKPQPAAQHAAYDALVCCHHGARYHPESGVCFEGPCVGARLTGLRVEERDGALWCVGLRRTGDDPTEPGG